MARAKGDMPRGLGRSVGLALALAVLALGTGQEAWAVSTGLKAAGAVVSSGPGWGSTFTLANLNTSDDLYAVNNSTGTTEAGVLSTFSFGIPAGNLIHGISVSVEGSASGGGAQTVSYLVELSWNAGGNWTTSQSGTFGTGADTTTVLGGPTNDWGRTWSDTELSNGNFQMRIYKNSGTRDLRVDQIQISVDYDPPPVPVYYSVGISRGLAPPANDLKSSGSLTVDISGGVATFSEAQAGNIGVGDEITYNTSSKAYISGRTSSTVYSLTTATGGVPAVVTGATVDSITRAFASLTAAESGSADANHLNLGTGDLVTANVQLNWACYDDGPMNDGDITINGWTTGPDNYIRIFTPVTSTEVGLSQRHDGVAGSGFRLVPALDAGGVQYHVLRIVEDYVRIEGLEIDGSNIANGDFLRAIEVGGNLASDIRLDSLVVHDFANAQQGNDADVFVINIHAEGSTRISNSVFYDFENNDNTSTTSLSVIHYTGGPALSHYLHNVTIYDVTNTASTSYARGVNNAQGTAVTVKNVAVFDVTNSVNPSNADCFSGVEPSWSHNVSSDDTAVCTDCQTGQTDYANYFLSVTPGSEDLHLVNDSLTLWGSSGADLDSDPNLPVRTDIDGEPRHATAPDIGADEMDPCPAAGPGWYDSSWTVRRGVVVNSALVTGDLSGFPVLVSIASDPGLAASAQADGDDILFTSSDGLTKLSHEIERYVSATGALVAWVKVPSVASAADTVFWMYYGNGSTGSQEDAAGVWDSDYRGVWHLSEDLSVSGQAFDSTSNGNHGTPLGGMGAANQVAGQMAGSLDFDGGDDKLDTGSAVSLDDLGPLTVSVWLRPDQPPAPDVYSGKMVTKYDASGAGRWYLEIDDSEFEENTFEFLKNHSTQSLIVDAANGTTTWASWQYVVATWDGSNLASNVHIYKNGVEVAYQTGGDGTVDGIGTPVSDAAAPLYIGGRHDSTQSYDGLLDEVRISAVVRPQAWIQTEYNNQANAAAFCTICGEQSETTAVRLASFTARGHDSAVLVEWETAQELDNLGFHLYRGSSSGGPWTRLDATMIPGLGSSPEGKQYRYVDSGLVNGTTYFYRLEDVDRRGRVTSHGPVSATPTAGVPEPVDGSGEGGGGGEEGGGGPEEPPPSPGTKPKASWKPHGEPGTQSLRVLESSPSGVTLELVTGGFYSQDQPDGTTRLVVPGFFDRSEPGRPTVPTRRLWQDVLVGRGVKLVSVTPSDILSFSGLTVPLAGKPVAVATESGTYEASALPVSPAEALRARAKDTTSAGTPFPASLARVHQTAFQGERKKAYVELSPLRVNETTGRVVLARRLVVRLAFTGAVQGERGEGSLGRRAPVPVADSAADTDPRVLARFATTARGLHAVSFSAIPGLTGPVATSSLRLSRLGASVPFHVEPRTASFGPTSTLYFLSDGTDSAYGNEAVYELSLGSGGLPMPVAVASARRITTTTPLATLRHEGSFEADLNYLPALTEARDVWVWDYGLAGTQGQDYPFTAQSPALVPETARLHIDLEGGSDTLVEPDHHVLAFVNGSLVGEIRFDGMRPATLQADVPTSLLRDGANTLRLENAGDTGSTASFVYLDRFSLEYPRPLTPNAGVLEGRASQAGRASLEAAPGSVLLDTTGPTPVFLGRALAGGRLAWNAEANRRYLAVFPEALLQPEVRPAPADALRATTNQADWIVLAPEALLPAAQTLTAHREAQGLAAMAVSLEDIVDEFGYGESGPHAVRDLLAFAFHRWQAPSPRYVLLLGDASYDPKGHLVGTSRPDLIPSPFTKSTFLWTPADPLYAAVNGNDSLPDIAIGRINAATLTEALAAVQKILDFENAGLTLSGKATLVADNPDQAGDFEANQDEIATLLPSRPVEKLFLTQLGATATKAAVRSAFDTGVSLMSYVGHGSSGLWATEGILRSPEIAAFAPQPRQPFVLTMTCSNGYFVSPYGNSLSERLVLAEGKGAIASFSPSGLSLNDAAHVYHRAVVSELEQGAHDRLGDLLLAAQAQYAASGAFPELLDFYSLLGDPGLKVR